MSLYSKTNKFLIALGAVLTLSSLNSCLKDDFSHQHSTAVLLNINEQNSMIMSVEMMERILQTTCIAQGDCDVDDDKDNDGMDDSTGGLYENNEDYDHDGKDDNVDTDDDNDGIKDDVDSDDDNDGKNDDIDSDDDNDKTPDILIKKATMM